MSDVRSFRLTDDTHDEIKKIAGNRPMEDVFRELLSVYKEKQVVRNAIDTARTNQLDSLCEQIKALFHGILDDQDTEYEKIKKQNAEELERLRRSINIKDEKIQEMQNTIQVLNNEITSLKSDNHMLQDLSNSLKNENAALKQNITLLENKGNEAPAEKPSTKKSVAAKKKEIEKKNSEETK